MSKIDVTKVIKCKVVGIGQEKQSILQHESDKLQDVMQLEKEGLDFLPMFKKIPINSANKQQAIRMYKKIKKNVQYPLTIRNDYIKIDKPNNSISKYWCRVPMKLRRGGVWLPIKPHKEFPEEYKLCESKLFKKGNDWWIHVTIKVQVTQKQFYSSVLAVDLGERNIATSVTYAQRNPEFMGREVRGTRRHYAWLRKRLGRKRCWKKIKQIGDKESRTVTDYLHKISKRIVERAKETDSLIVLGNLTGIRKSAKGKGRRFNRIVGNMPFYELTQQIEYKAKAEGILVMKINERGTSKTCSGCGYVDKLNRKSRGFFKCKSCGSELNADYNGALNIMNRSLEYIFNDEAMSGLAFNMIGMKPTSVNSSSGLSHEANHFNG